jgi:hypothetical protein
MNLVKETETYVLNLYKQNKNDLLLFHNIAYVQKTVDFAAEICKMEALSPQETEEVLVAAWLFPVGFLTGYPDYKKHSLVAATTFLEEKQVGNDQIILISRLIETVIDNSVPENRQGKILHDATEFYLAADDFLLWLKYRRQERNFFLAPKLTKRSFLQTALNHMLTHHYYTKSANTLFLAGKETNLLKLRLIVSKELERQIPVDNRILINGMKDEIKSLNQKMEKRLSSVRGFDALYRITARNQVALSGLADNKSNILISLNTLIVTAIITFVFIYKHDLNYLMVPTFIVIGYSVVSISLAILATRPKIKPGVFKMDDFYSGKVNLLFYGNFYKMDYDDYNRAMRDMLGNQELLLNNLNRDQYTFGKILGRKFMLINYSFTVFLVGFILSVVSFAAVLFFFQ